MPKIAELAERVFGLVAEELDVTKESIMSKSRKAEMVDARHTAAVFLSRHNVGTARIAGLLNMTERNVRSIITEFDGRIASNRCLREVYKRLKDKLMYEHE